MAGSEPRRHHGNGETAVVGSDAHHDWTMSGPTKCIVSYVHIILWYAGRNVSLHTHTHHSRNQNDISVQSPGLNGARNSTISRVRRTRQPFCNMCAIFKYFRLRFFQKVRRNDPLEKSRRFTCVQCTMHTYEFSQKRGKKCPLELAVWCFPHLVIFDKQTLSTPHLDNAIV